MVPWVRFLETRKGVSYGTAGRLIPEVPGAKPAVPRISSMAGVGQPLRIALAQINATVGDIQGNKTAIVDALSRARATGAQIAVFPELVVNGYPPEDLLLKT